MKISIINEGVVNFGILQAMVLKDLAGNEQVQNWFAGHDAHITDVAIMSIIGAHGMARARALIAKAAGRQISPMLYDIPDVNVDYAKTPSAEHMKELRNSQIYRDVYNLYLSYFIQ